jgi:hypothetical protein
MIILVLVAAYLLTRRAADFAKAEPKSPLPTIPNTCQRERDVLLTANRKNDLSLLATTNDLDYIRSMRFRRRTNKLERRPHI